MRNRFLTRPATAGGSLAALLALACATLTTGETQAQPPVHEITVTVIKVKALDKADELSSGDFFTRVTIDGDAQSTPQIKSESEIKPDWKIRKDVAPGEHRVKIELIDKNVSVNDPIDINKVDRKRDLEFQVDTRRCRIEGFSRTYRCGASISRAGQEEKKAEITFAVDVKKK